jgi:hypothetical protein
VLARMRGWKNILLLDDDVSRLKSDDGSPSADFGLANLADALVAMGEYGSRGVGWVLEHFPDNSVVCHARRAIGCAQDKFIGGGALLLRCDENLPFFPATYNEDWLFLLPFMLADEDRGRALIEGGLVGQDEYPVYVEKRAISEELGDTLGEGLFNLLTLPERHFFELMSDYVYWQRVVAARKSLIRDVCAGLSRLGEGTGRTAVQANAALKAVKAAGAVHSADWSAELATYCRRWHHDLEVWRDWFPTVERGMPLKHLGLADNAAWWNGA